LELVDHGTTVNDCNTHAMALTATCALFNARSLKNKLPDFHELIRRDYSMVFVTESWLRNSIVDGHIDNTSQFHIYRKDRSDRLGGGILALVSKSYCSYEISVPAKFHVLEIIAHSIVLSARRYRFITVYRPPEFNLACRSRKYEAFV